MDGPWEGEEGRWGERSVRRLPFLSKPSGNKTPITCHFFFCWGHGPYRRCINNTHTYIINYLNKE